MLKRMILEGSSFGSCVSNALYCRPCFASFQFSSTDVTPISASLAGDMLDDLRTPLLDITNVKLSNPSLECCSLHSEEECEKERLEREQVTQSQMNGFDIARWDGKSDMSGSVRREESLGVLALLIATVLLV